MSAWAPAVAASSWDGPSNSGNDQWNDAPAEDTWNDNAGANGGEPATSFDEGGANGFDAPAGGGGGACYNCGQEG